MVQYGCHEQRVSVEPGSLHGKGITRLGHGTLQGFPDLQGLLPGLKKGVPQFAAHCRRHVPQGRTYIATHPVASTVVWGAQGSSRQVLQQCLGAYSQGSLFHSYKGV